jgi:replicative DNA helicase
MSTDIFERTLPHNLEAEKALLGAVLMFDQAALDVAGLVSAPEFFRDAHRRIFQAIQNLSIRRIAVDLVTVKDALAASGELESVGGPMYLASLTDGVPRSTNVPSYAAIVREKARLRTLIAGAKRLLSEAYEAGEDAGVVLDRAEQVLFDLGKHDTTGGFKRLSALLPAVLEQIEGWCQTKTGVSGVASGFTELDGYTRGFQPGNLVIIAARPAMGKSALVLNIAQHVASAGQVVGLYSLEMSESELAIRTLTAAAGIDGHRLQRGYVRDSEWGRIAAAMGTLSELPLFIDDSPFITAMEMRSRARRLKAEHGLDLLIVDYTQLMLGNEGDKRENRTLELAGITRALKGLAKELKIPVIALSQLSRRVEERQDKRPMLSDLRESGSLEQDADLVIFIYRAAVYKDTEENRHLAELIIGKQRNGPIGTVRLGWQPEQTRFVNLVNGQVPPEREVFTL